MRSRSARLFAYGTLANAAARTRLLGRETRAVHARLAGFERGRARYIYIAPNSGATVVGVVIDGLGAPDFSILDEYEEVPRLYTRQSVVVTTDGGWRLRCWVYIPTGWEREA
ncbi:MAG TPA: gamma-glutamylcyclotransferase family protein [Candidatus Binataceae bacterium]|nr:gamma-glutamylcyclotransferase family protein [Candidatus Binataceae bacterium]